MNDLVVLHREVLADLDREVALVGVADLGLPTPCAGWTVADLLAHSVGQHRGFAAAVRDGDAPQEAYAPVPWDRTAWADSVTVLLQTFATADLAGTVHQVELRPDQALPVRFVVAAQLLDSAVHAWDLAVSRGGDYRPGPEALATVLGIAQRIPERGDADVGGAFAPAVPVTGDAWAQVLGLLGRDPGWSAG